MKRLRLFGIILIFSLLIGGCFTENMNLFHKETGNQDHKMDQRLPVIKILADSPGAVSLFQKEEKHIEDTYGVQLEYYYPNRLTENMEEFLFATDDQFDLFVLFPVKIPLYVENDLLLPLDIYTQNDPSLEEIIPIYRKVYMNYSGKDYGLVFDGDAHLLFYRKDIFETYQNEYKQKYGEDLLPPSTWEEYDRISRFLTRDLDGDGKIDIYGTAILSSDGMRYIWFAERYLSSGEKYFDETMHPLIHTDKGINILKDLIDLYHSDACPPNSMYDWVDLNHAFLQGKIAMVIQWSDTARFSYDDHNWKSKVKNKVGWTLVPSGDTEYPRGGTWIGRVLAVSKDTKNPEKVWQVIQYLTSKDVSKRAVNSYETINDPFRMSHFIPEGTGPFQNEAENQYFLDTLYSSLMNTNTDLMIPGGWEYMKVLDYQMGLALIRKISAEEALNNTAIEWEKITEKYGRENQKLFYQEWLRKLEEISPDDRY